MNSLLKSALEYRKKGWSVIPIKPNSKLPLIASWKQYQTEVPTIAQINAWWKEAPNAGIALVCGEISGVIVVDIDSGHGEVDTKGLELSPTLSTKTGTGGSHLIYKWRKGLVGAKVGIRKGVDIRSTASYIVLPPSIHPNGNAYEWTIDENEPIAPAPKWLEEKNQEAPKTNWDEFLKDKNDKGLRNMSATKLAGKIMYEMAPSMWDTLGVSVFKQWNKEYNNPSLPEKELMTIWKSIKKTHIKNASEEEKSEVWEEDGDEKAILKDFLKNKTAGTFYLASYIVRKYSIITVGEAEREMFVYRDGMYIRAENEVIFPEIQRLLGHHVTKNSKTETFHKIADATSKSRSVFTSAPLHLIPLKNGVYNLETGLLQPHSPDHKFTFQFPIEYKDGAECPNSIAFMHQVLDDEQFLTMQEWLGYYFYRNYMFKKAVIFVGGTDTGKTTFLEMIYNLVGRANMSGVSLQKMAGDKFAGAQMYEKHANIVDELDPKDISGTGNFKVATGAGSMTGEYKFGNQFSFVNFAKLTFACNKIPSVKDFDDEAYFNRWMIIAFNKVIEKKIVGFINTLTTPEEQAGLFLFAMEGLRRLLKEGRFSYNKTPMETKTEMMKSGSSIAVFAAEKIEESVGEEITKEKMYDEYSAFCSERKMSVETIKMFGTKFPFYVPYVNDGRITTLGKNGKPERERGWRNVKIKGSADAPIDDFASFRQPIAEEEITTQDIPL